jgi:PHD/YefM family antitoxin component YafN of YafNO toxin-antitoxin module
MIMELQTQIIKKNGKNEYVVISYEDYLKIKEKLEDYEDLLDLRKAKEASVTEPTVPFKKVQEIIKSKKG